MTCRFYPALMFFKDGEHLCSPVDFDDVEGRASTYSEAKKFAQAALQLKIEEMETLPIPTSIDRMPFLVHERKSNGYILLLVDTKIPTDMDFSQETKDDHVESNKNKRRPKQPRQRG